jgi:vacuolar protein-sorting-associated protein 4
MRRRFEKRVYIALPEVVARTGMFKINLGDTPHHLSDEDFHLLGERTEGYSGSDIKVLVQEALMEPLRKCQQAKQFLRDNGGFFHPCDEYPNCPLCPMVLHCEPIPGSHCVPPDRAKHTVCSNCGAERMSLYDVAGEKLAVPTVGLKDFERALRKAHSSVGTDELERFVRWTEEFGQEG